MAKVTNCEFGIAADVESSAVAIVERWRGMSLDFDGNFEFADPAKRLAQNLGFEAKLVLIPDVLIVAATARSKVRAGRSTSQLRALDDRVQFGMSEARPLLDDHCFHALLG